MKRRLASAFVLMLTIGFPCLLAADPPEDSAPPPASAPAAFERRTEEIRVSEHSIHLKLIKPLAPHPPTFLILFASGDAGWRGTSKVVFEHIAERGYYLAGYSSREALKHTKRTGHTLTVARVIGEVASLVGTAKHRLGLPDTTPTILTGFSRGASMVLVGAGNETTRLHFAGAVAMALTREADYVSDPEEARRSPEIQMDEKRRLLTYPAIARLDGAPVAIIQGSGDKFVTAAEARGLFGPDTSSRRLYTVENASHGFKGGRDVLLRNLDEALGWVTSFSAAAP